jgi:hypothetical protein
MKTILIIFLLFIQITSFGQSSVNNLDEADKHYSLLNLAQEYIDKNDFTTAITCIDSAKKFSTHCRCGTCKSEDYFNTKVLYAKCYYGQGEFKRTIDLLSPDMFDFNYFSSNKELIEKLYEAYLKVYTKEEIKNEFINVCNPSSIKKQPSNDEFEYEIKIFNRTVRLYYYSYKDKYTEELKKQECINQIKQSNIYKLAISQSNTAF